jgi:hypothetical protein
MTDCLLGKLPYQVVMGVNKLKHHTYGTPKLEYKVLYLGQNIVFKRYRDATNGERGELTQTL